MTTNLDKFRARLRRGPASTGESDPYKELRSSVPIPRLNRSQAGQQRTVGAARALENNQRYYDRDLERAGALGVEDQGEQIGVLRAALGILDKPRQFVTNSLSAATGIDVENPGLLAWDGNDDVVTKGVKAVGNFGLDVALDPLTYLSMGAASVGKKGAAELADAGARDAVRSGKFRLRSSEADKLAELHPEMQEFNRLLVEAPEAAETFLGKMTGRTGDDAFKAQHAAQDTLGSEIATARLSQGPVGMRRRMVDLLGEERADELLDLLPREVTGGMGVRGNPFGRGDKVVDAATGKTFAAPKVARLQDTAFGEKFLDGKALSAKFKPLGDASIAWHKGRNTVRATGLLKSVREAMPIGGIPAQAYTKALDAIKDQPESTVFHYYRQLRDAWEGQQHFLNTLTSEDFKAVSTATALRASAPDVEAFEAAFRKAWNNPGGEFSDVGEDAMAAANVLHARMAEISTLAKSVGMDLGHIENYVPRQLTKEGIDYLRYTRAADTVRTGRGGSATDPTKKRGRWFTLTVQGTDLTADQSRRLQELADAGEMVTAEGRRVALVDELDGRWLSPEEVNGQLGFRFFEDDPIQATAKYAEAMRRRIADHRLLNVLTHEGVVRQAGDIRGVPTLKSAVLRDLIETIQQADRLFSQHADVEFDNVTDEVLRAQQGIDDAARREQAAADRVGPLAADLNDARRVSTEAEERLRRFENGEAIEPDLGPLAPDAPIRQPRHIHIADEVARRAPEADFIVDLADPDAQQNHLARLYEQGELTEDEFVEASIAAADGTWATAPQAVDDVVDSVPDAVDDVAPRAVDAPETAAVDNLAVSEDDFELRMYDAAVANSRNDEGFPITHLHGKMRSAPNGSYVPNIEDAEAHAAFVELIESRGWTKVPDGTRNRDLLTEPQLRAEAKELELDEGKYGDELVGDMWLPPSQDAFDHMRSAGYRLGMLPDDGGFATPVTTTSRKKYLNGVDGLDDMPGVEKVVRSNELYPPEANWSEYVSAASREYEADHPTKRFRSRKERRGTIYRSDELKVIREWADAAAEADGWERSSGGNVVQIELTAEGAENLAAALRAQADGLSKRQHATARAMRNFADEFGREGQVRRGLFEQDVDEVAAELPASVSDDGLDDVLGPAVDQGPVNLKGALRTRTLDQVFDEHGVAEDGLSPMIGMDKLGLRGWVKDIEHPPGMPNSYDQAAHSKWIEDNFEEVDVDLASLSFWQREVSKPGVKLYVDALDSGEWDGVSSLGTGTVGAAQADKVIVDLNGTVTDGYHRVAALLLSGKAYAPVMVPKAANRQGPMFPRPKGLIEPEAPSRPSFTDAGEEQWAIAHDAAVDAERAGVEDVVEETVEAGPRTPNEVFEEHFAGQSWFDEEGHRIQTAKAREQARLEWDRSLRQSFKDGRLIPQDVVESAPPKLLEGLGEKAARRVEVASHRAGKKVGKAESKLAKAVARHEGARAATAEATGELEQLRQFEQRLDELGEELLLHDREMLDALAELNTAMPSGRVPTAEEHQAQVDMFDQIMQTVMRSAERNKELVAAARTMLPARTAEGSGRSGWARAADRVATKAGKIANKGVTATRESGDLSRFYRRQEELVPLGQVRTGNDAGLSPSNMDALRMPAELTDSFAPDAIRQAVEKMWSVRVSPNGPARTHMEETYRAWFSIFKTTATIGRGPGYHVRNVIGGHWQNWVRDVTVEDHKQAAKMARTWAEAASEIRKEMAGDLSTRSAGRLSPKDAKLDVNLAELDGRIQRRMREKLSGEQIAPGVTLADIYDQMLRQDVMRQSRLLESLSTATGQESVNLNQAINSRQNVLYPGRDPDDLTTFQRGAERFVNAGWFRGSANVQNVSEMYLRGAAFIRGVKDYGLDDEGMAASMLVKALHFDYADLSDFERKWLVGTGRGGFGMVPFWSWTKGNIPLAWRQLWYEPGKVNRLMAANDALAEQFADEEQSIVPSWMRERFGWATQWSPVGDNALVLGIESPITDLERMFKVPQSGRPGEILSVDQFSEALGSLSPAVKAPIEFGAGVNLFTGAKMGRVAAPWWTKAPGLRSAFDVSENPETGVQEADGRLVQTLSNLLPPLGQARRVAPFGDPQSQERLASTAISQLAPVVSAATATDRQQAGELSARMRLMQRPIERAMAEQGVTRDKLDELIRVYGVEGARQVLASR